MDTKIIHLAGSNIMLRMVLQTGPVSDVDFGMGIKEFSNNACICAVLLHAEGERLEADVSHPTVQRAWHRSYVANQCPTATRGHEAVTGGSSSSPA